MNKTFKKIFSVCCAAVTTLTATLSHSTNLRAGDQDQKIVFVGPEEAGKSALISRICDNIYNSNYAPTIGADFNSTPRQRLWDLSGNRSYNIIGCCFRGADLCVLSISKENQKTEDFLNILAKYNVPKVVLCITKTNVDKPASKEVSSLLETAKQTLTDVTVFNEVLYTSAKDNTFIFCTPDKFDSTTPTPIHGSKPADKVLANKLYELCGGKAEDFQSETYEEGTFYYAFGLGITASLLTWISGTAYYEYDRHFSEQKNTKTETKFEQTPKANQKISS